MNLSKRSLFVLGAIAAKLIVCGLLLAAYSPAFSHFLLITSMFVVQALIPILAIRMLWKWQGLQAQKAVEDTLQSLKQKSLGFNFIPNLLSRLKTAKDSLLTKKIEESEQKVSAEKEGSKNDIQSETQKEGVFKDPIKEAPPSPFNRPNSFLNGGSPYYVVDEKKELVTPKKSRRQSKGRKKLTEAPMTPVRKSLRLIKQRVEVDDSPSKSTTKNVM